MIIDEDPGLTDPLLRVLTTSGFNVDAAAGNDGLAKIKDNCPEIVLLDLVMPEMDGWHTFGAIRLFSPCQSSCHLRDNPSVVTSILHVGADDYLLMPVSSQVLVARLNRLAKRTGAPQPLPREDRVWHPEPRLLSP